MIRRWLPQENAPKHVTIKDTADFLRIEYGDVVVLEGVPYLVRNNEREGRFGIDDEPKFWVKRARNLATGEVKILKWVFRERFEAKVGGYVFECVRSPEKEARILELVRGRPDFMQGRTVFDSEGKQLRILDFISGTSLNQLPHGLGTDHHDYFFHHFPGILDSYIKIVEAIRFLHEHNEKHGDIRRDHIIRDSSTGWFRWIDFDFNYRHGESRFGYDLFGLGNVLVFLTGRGDVTTHQLMQDNPALLERLDGDDVGIVFHNRVSNLGKIFPYIPETLNRILRHFSAGASVFYEDTRELLADLGEAREELKKATGI
ncbi:MAG TPA: hypothetical protein VK654_16280 [Nitrospirota bacterium]|nr:hypothetical protein [Nitrospirota bacterium]